MLEKLTLQAFKAFGERVEVPLAPLTLIYGPNSAGKSSILQALLLLKQSHESNWRYPHLLETTGDLVNLGGLSSLLHHGKKPSDLMLTLEWRSGKPEFPELGDVLYSDTGETAERLALFAEKRLAFTWRQDALQCSCPDAEEPAPSRLRLDVPVRHARPVFAKPMELAPFAPEGLRHVFEHLPSFADRPPEELSVSRRQWLVASLVSWNLSREWVELEPEGGSPFLLLCDFEEALDWLREDKATPWCSELTADLHAEANALTHECMWAIHGWAYGFLRHYSKALEQVAYMGPAREPPLRLPVPIHRFKPSHHGDAAVRWASHVRWEQSRVSRWLERLGVPYALELEMPRDGSLAGSYRPGLTAVPSGHRLGLADVGYGVSQVLPILIQGCLQGWFTCLVEQPELHLHPRLQADLADFFIEHAGGKSIAGSGNGNGAEADVPKARQWIIETHSEALMLRVQRRIREKVIAPEVVRVLYVESASEGARVRELRLDEDGQFLDDWPDGFFEERLDDLL